MPRAAGSDTHYSFLLNGDAELGLIRLPSVTTILRRVFGAPQYVVDWATGFESKEAMHEYRDTRSAEGTKAHSFVEGYVAGKLDDPTTGFDEAFLKFVSEESPVFTLSENVVYSLGHGYAGTLDLGILESNGRTRVVDVKTRNKTIYKAYETDLLQCTAYAMAASEMNLIDPLLNPLLIGVLMLKENGRYTYIEEVAKPEQWLATLALYKALERGKHA